MICANENCKKEFEPQNKRQKYCNYKCNNAVKARKHYNVNKTRPKYIFICNNCGKEFYAGFKEQFYIRRGFKLPILTHRRIH